MDAARWRRIDELFHEAAACARGERQRLLDDCCAGDFGLRTEVESLLAAHERASSSALAWPLFRLDNAPERPVSPPLPSGRTIGCYRLGRVIGAGGMGTVYEAEQESPRRTVALKLMRALPCQDEVTERFFRREGQALARLQHPGIAAIHEAGQSEDGWYYFAMERVEGRPLTQFARERSLSIEQRLELFAQICDAVHYAHQRGVIHRDLKPSNILVTDAGQPKVLDFGLARVIDPEVDATQITQPGAFHGTLAYASPEQARGRSEDIDARSDVYSLGVILYELLTDRHPYDLDGRPLPEAARVICEEPPSPLGTHDRGLRGDLETIAGKAMEKEPARRYASAAALGDDIRRHLQHQPILAHPPSALYQFRKMAARHRLAFILSTGLLAVIICATIAMGWLAVRFAQQRDLARQSQAQASAARDDAEEYAAFLEKLFEEARVGASSTKVPTLRQVLDDGYAKLDAVENSLVRARLMTVIGNVYSDLDELQRARELLETAVAIRRAELGSQHPDVAESLIALTGAFTRMRRLEEGDAAVAEAIEILTAALGPDDARVAKAWRERGAVWYWNGDYASAAEYFRTALEIDRRRYETGSPELAEAQTDLAWALIYLNRLDEAEPLMKEAIDIHHKLGNAPEKLGVMEGLAQLAWRRGDRSESERLYAEELELARGVYEKGHPKLAWIISNYAYTIEHNQGLAQAEPLYREAVQILRGAGADGHRDIGRCLKMLGRNLLGQAKRDEAAQFLQEAADVQKKVGGSDDAVESEVRTLLNEARQP